MKRTILICITLAGCSTLDDEPTSSTQQASLADGRERLMADYAGRRGQSAAAMWPQLTAAQQGVFLTLTHRLSLSVLPDGSNALDQLDAVYSIRGQDGGSCGGGEHNRMFFSLTPALHDAFINRSLDDVWGGRSWKPSGDIAGPHGPFDASNETEYGSPRGQVHFFSRAPVYPPGQTLAFVSCPSGYALDTLIDASMEEEGTMRFFDPSTGDVAWCHYVKIHHPSTRQVCRDGLEGCIHDPEMAEMDQDYTWNHDSATTCSYDGYASGLDMYDANHGRGTSIARGVRRARDLRGVLASVESLYDPVKWLADSRAFVERARSGTISDEYISDIELAYDVSAWPQPWLAADVLTYELGSALEAGVGMVLNAEHAITARPEGDVDALIAAGDLDSAWRACFAPELADVIEARDALAPIEKITEPKKKSDLENVWATAARTLSPRSAFAGTWPTKWKAAQRRMRVLYARPRSPLFAAAAIAFANREDLGYTSISAQTFWQSMCWFIAEQADVRQLPALEALERRLCAIEGRKELYAKPALRAVTPRPLSDKARAAIAAIVVEKPAPRATLSLTSAEERGVAADLLLEEGDPRGELIVVQRTIAASGATPELRKRQKQLLMRHGKAWCPSMIAKDTCVFRDGVPVAGQMQFFSDAELASFAGAKALVTFETLVIPGAAMGPIEPSTIADVARSLPALRHVITTDEAALALARGAPTAIEHLTIEGSRVVPRDRPGLPKLRRVDAPSVQSVEVFGCDDPGEWDRLRRAGKHVAVVFSDLHYLDGGGWELWAEGDAVTAKPLGGARAKNLAAMLARVVSWEGVRELRVPENFAAISVGGVAVTPTDAVDPERFGTSLWWAKSRR